MLLKFSSFVKAEVTCLPNIHWEDTVFFKESHNILERIGNQTKLF